MCRSLFLSVLISLAGACAAKVPQPAEAPSAAAEATTCAAVPAGAGEWSRPVAVDGVPEGRSIRWPSLALRGDTAYMAANLFPIDPLAPVDPRPLTVLRLPGGPIGAPPGEHSFAFPEGVFDRAGTYHLFWGDPPSPGTRLHNWPGGPPSSLWHSSYDARGWSAPERILSSGHLGWAGERHAIAVDASNRIHLLVPTASPTGALRLAHLRGTGGGWERSEIPIATAYAGLVAWGRDSLLAVLVAPDPAARSDANSVLVATSSDAGATWSAPALLSPSGGRPATVPIALRAAGGALHLLWVQNRAGEFTAEALRHRVSRDGGATWTTLPDAPLTGEPLRVQAVADRCGSIWALAESFTGDGVVLDEIGWRGENVAVRRLFPELVVAANAGLASDGCMLRLVWSAVARPGEDATTWTAERRVCG